MRKILLAIIAISMLDFLAFAAGVVVLHGDAIGARSACPPGDYVVNKGACHPVSHAAYVYSKVQSYSVMILFPFAMGAALILHYQKASAAADPPQWR